MAGYLSRALKIVVSISLLGWLLHKADLRSMFQALATADSLPCIGVLFSILLINLFQVIRWRALLKTEGIGFKKLLQFHFVSIFFQSFLPSSVSVDVIKGFLLSKEINKGYAYASVSFARLSGMIVLLFFMIAVLLIKPSLIVEQLYANEVYAVLIAIVIATVIMFSKKTSRFIFGRFPRLSSSRIFLKAKAFRELIYAYRKRPVLFAQTLLYAAIIHFFTMLAGYFSYKAVGANIPLPVFFIVSPIVYAVLLLPISINGIGAREGVMLLLLSRWGANYELVLAAALITYVIIYSLSLTGGIVYLMSGLKGVLRQNEKEQ